MRRVGGGATAGSAAAGLPAITTDPTFGLVVRGPFEQAVTIILAELRAQPVRFGPSELETVEGVLRKLSRTGTIFVIERLEDCHSTAELIQTSKSFVRKAWSDGRIESVELFGRRWTRLSTIARLQSNGATYAERDDVRVGLPKGTGRPKNGIKRPAGGGHG